MSIRVTDGKNSEFFVYFGGNCLFAKPACLRRKRLGKNRPKIFKNKITG